MTKSVKIAATPRLCDLEFVKEGINQAYIDAIHNSGARIDLLLIDHERIMEFANEYDGLLITGGVDVTPALYGELRKFGNENYDYEYDLFDIKLIKAFNALNKPILGICRGLQIINVAFGGNLYQDIDSFYKNLNSKHLNNNICDDRLSHSININFDSLLYKIVKSDKILVNSYHHQAINELAKGFKVSARCEDGVVEAIEKDNILAVQWHPEKIYDYESQKAIFDYFISLCKECH